MKSLRDEMFDYAQEALVIRDRQDVYNAVVHLIQNWNFYDNDEERRFAFAKIQRDSVKNPRHPVNDTHVGDPHVLGAYRRERCRVPSFMSAYLAEMNKNT